MKVDWTQYPLSQELWEVYRNSSRTQRYKFLKDRNLQYARGDVPRCEICNHGFFNCVCDNEEFQQKRKLQKIEQTKSFDDKLKHSEQMVADKCDMILRNNLKVYLAYSGGIDSECCLRLFDSLVRKGTIKVIVGNTLNELPDTYRRIYQAQKELGVKFLYALPERGITFETNAEKFGLPIYPRNNIGKKVDENIKKPTIKCCHNLKEKPQANLTKEFDGNILGLRANESRARNMAIKSRGDCHFNNTTGKWHIRPIAWWTREDEWNFQKLRGFNYNGIYDKTNIGKIGKYKTSTGRIIDIRSGCAYCPQGIHQGYLEWLYEFYPKYFEKLVKIYDNVAIKHGDGVDFKKVLEIKKVKDPRDLKDKSQPF